MFLGPAFGQVIVPAVQKKNAFYWDHEAWIWFKEIYKFDDKCIAVVHGHTHLNFTEEFSGIKTKRVSVGALCSSKKGDGESYLLLTENGLEYKKIWKNGANTLNIGIEKQRKMS